MLATIINIGDELLIGQTVNTNASWMAQQLNQIGVKIYEMITVADEELHLLEALNKAKEKADLILITGGLGPTNDDLTKQILCEYFRGKLILNKTILNDVKSFFKKRGRPLTERNKEQALIPDNCIPIRNKLGTAPGMWFSSPLSFGEGKGVRHFISMPGVPYEMKAMMTNFVLPEIKKKFKLPVIIHKNILTAGIGESFLADKIKFWEDNLPKHIKLAYLPSLGMVKLRLTTIGENKKMLRNEITSQVKKLKTLTAEYIFSEEEFGLEKIIGDLLRRKKATIATAESCTGGYITHLITSVAGSSDYFKGSIVSYANEIKEKELGVKKATLKKFGAVSEEVCKEMLTGILKKMKTDYAIAVTGIAGPSGGTKDKPMGTVWISVGSVKKLFTKKFQFHFTRLQNIEITGVNALNMLRKFLLEQ